MIQSFSFHKFESGVNVIQLRDTNAESQIDEVYQLVESMGCCDSMQLAKISGVSLVLASERLLMAEAHGKICRDDTIEGIIFYPNKFITCVTS